MVDHTGRAVKKTGQESELYQSAQRFRNALINREDRAVLQMREIYGSAFDRLRRELAALDARLAEREAAGKPLADAALAMRDRLESLIAQTSQALNDSTFDAVGVVTDAQEQALDYVNQNTESLVMAATGSPSQARVAISFDSLPKEALREFAGFSSDGSPLAVLFDSIAQDFPNALRLSLASGLAQGKNPRSMIREMLAIANISANRAETIARTEMIRASREGQRLIYESNPVVVSYRRVATQDARVCLACLALSGTLHKTAEIMPSHPNCRCVMVPVTPSLAEITGDPSIPDLRPGAITPDNILAGLDEKEIVGIMGPKRYQLFKDGTPLADMVSVRFDPKWGPTTRILPIKDIGQGPKPGPSPEPPPPPRPAPAPAPAPKPAPSRPRVSRQRKPKVEAQVEQKFDNRDPKQVIAKLRAIIGANEQDTEYANLSDRRTEWLKYGIEKINEMKSSGASVSEIEDFRDNVWQPELQRLGDLVQKINYPTQEVLEKMRKVLESDDPITTEIDFDATVFESPIPSEKQSSYRRMVSKALSYMDKRNLAVLNNLKTGQPTIVDHENPEKMRLSENKAQGTYGFCEWAAYGEVSLNVDLLDFTSEISYKNKSAFRTLSHEIVHWVHIRSDDMRIATNNFWNRRTAGDEWEPNPSYGGEMKKDKWPEDYCGKRYKSAEEKFDILGAEIPTRGIELMLENPIRFAEEDPEYFEFVLTHIMGGRS